jgi:hypothetical protein
MVQHAHESIEAHRAIVFDASVLACTVEVHTGLTIRSVGH